MTIDITQFYQTFFEESLDGLGKMESMLLEAETRLEKGKHPDGVLGKEELNTIFRVVHSIKGGSGTFGFGPITDFSHVLETLLDELRDGRYTLDKEIVNLMLKTVDALRTLLVKEKNQEAIDISMVQEIYAQLQNLQRKFGVTSEGIDKTEKTEKKESKLTHNVSIKFKPHSSLFLSGNDPLRFMKALQELGRLHIHVDTEHLPDWADFDPEHSYLHWSMELETSSSEDEIRAVFEWISDDCDLSISKLNRRQSDAVASEINESIRVSVPKIDALVDLVGELVITQTIMSELTNNYSPNDLPKLQASVTELERHIRELQERVMSIRMMPIGFAFNMLPRTVRDYSKQLGKKISLKISGEQTELDKAVIERLSDPLLHIIRNSIDHGIELPDQRKALNKPEIGTIQIQAYQKGGNVVVEIKDDGQGLQEQNILKKARQCGLIDKDAELSKNQIYELIFLPGFSTAQQVTDISGRGVGMDVVRNNIRSLGGSVEVNSDANQGTRITIRLPLTLAIMDGLNAQVGQQIYIFPLISIIESIHLVEGQVSQLAGGPEVVSWRGEFLPLIRLHQLFHLQPLHEELTQGTCVIVEAEGKKAGIYVDELLGQQQVVIKNLERHYRKVNGVGAATIMGDGVVALILDVAGLVTFAHSNPNAALTPASNRSDQNNLSLNNTFS